MFQRVLRAYAGKLVARLPRGQPGLVSGTEGQVKVLSVSMSIVLEHEVVAIIL